MPQLSRPRLRPNPRAAIRRSLWLVALLVFAALSQACWCGEDTSVVASENDDGLDEIRHITLVAPPTEGSQPAMFSAQPEPSMTDLGERLSAAARDNDCKGVLLRVGPMAGAWGRAPEIAAALGRVREAGKPVHCHFEMTDNLGYALMAQSCDRLSMTPAGDLNLVGVAAHVFYAKQLLTKIGVQADFMQVGRFKGAADTFTLDAMPDTTRETLGGLLDDFTSYLVDSIARGRELSPERVLELIDEGPHDAQSAKQAGLIDDIGFDDEAAEHARVAGAAQRVREIEIAQTEEPVGLSEILSALAGEAPRTHFDGPRVALAYLEGQIVDAHESGAGSARSGPFVRAMRSFATDDEIKALVLRIDSPGGSALASDRMWHAVRRVASKKPVIVSVGDMAASGGYYIASAGTEIYAQDTSIVGSIGVVAGKLTFEELADNIGLTVEVLSRGRNAAWTTPAKPFSAAERQILERTMQRTYDRFIRRIVAGRNMERQAVERVAEGRIMSGADARTAGLVDTAGGLGDAIDRARELSGVDRESPVETLAPAPRAARSDRAGHWRQDTRRALTRPAAGACPGSGSRRGSRIENGAHPRTGTNRCGRPVGP